MPFKPVDAHPDFPKLEEEILKFWEDNKIFEKSVEQNRPGFVIATPTPGQGTQTSSDEIAAAPKGPRNDGNNTFVFYEGPPTANAAPGIHHVEARAFKDIIPRFQTMRGKYVRRKAGWDTHGLPVELQIEKKLGISGKKQIESLKETKRESIAYFNKLCRQSVWEFKAEWEKLTRRMGFWVDLRNPYVTYENGYIEKVWGVIKQIWDEGLVYQGHKVVPYCPRCGTALSSHEVAQGYKTVADTSVYVKFRMTDDGLRITNKAKPHPLSAIQDPVYILSWTTTPWTLPGNVALAVGENIDYVVVKAENLSPSPSPSVGEGGQRPGEVEYYILAKERLSSVIATPGLTRGKQSKSEGIAAAPKGPRNDGDFEIVAEFTGKDLVGLEYEPLFEVKGIKGSKGIEQAFKIYPADFVTTKDGTGVVHTAVMYGEDDYRLGEEVGLPKHHTVDEEGRFTEDLSAYGLAGLKVKGNLSPSVIPAPFGPELMAEGKAGIQGMDPRVKPEDDRSEEGKMSAEDIIIDYLKSQNLLFKTEDYQHEYPHCWRCSTPLLYYARNSWFIKMSSLREQLQKNNQDINWVPEYIKEGRFGQWLGEAKDWAISRERYWGTPLPFWQCGSCNHYQAVGSMEELEGVWIKDNGSRITDRKSLNPQSAIRNPLDLHRPYVDDIILKCEKCGGEAKRIPEVADVWFDSGSMPFAQDYNENLTPVAYDGSLSSEGVGNNEAIAQFPADFISEAIDQTRGWFYTLLAISTLLGRGTAYKNVICLGHLLDAKGQKMSKSKGNVVNPWDVGNKYGFDAIRWYFYTVNQPGDTKLFDEKDLAGIQRRVQLILWNTYNYFVTYANEAGWEYNPQTSPQDTESSENIMDQWVNAKLQDLINSTTVNFEKYDVFHASRSIEEFITELSTWYVRRGRGRKDKAFFATLYKSLIYLTKLLAPGMPFLAESIYQNLHHSDYAESIHLDQWPKTQDLRNDQKDLLGQMQTMRSLVEEVHALRAKAGIKLRQPLGRLAVRPINPTPKIRDFRGTPVNGQATGSSPIYRLLQDEVNVKEVVVADKLELDTTITEDLKIEGVAAELTRQIQIFRKESGLHIGEIVDLSFTTESDIIKKAVAKVDRNKIYVNSLNQGPAEGGKEIVAEGEKMIINFRK